ncbi:MAG: pyruvate carboxylase subunit B [Planctomycetales bacterium]
MMRIAEAYARLCPQLFSIEMWGGATFDTSMRFLKECPWQRLADLREKIPNILFQMLLRASNAVGYTNYPDNIVKEFVKESAQTGVDVFRVFDALNWAENMQVAMDAVRDAGGICEAAICYTGDILNPARPKYSLKYYVELAKDLEKRGAHILAIKDMAGLCKPYAAELLVKTLKQEIGIPIHFHTHDMSGVQSSSILNGAEVGLDIADAAIASMSGMTSQANLNSVVEALHFTPRDTGLDSGQLKLISHYWGAVRDFYAPFETGSKGGDADLYTHEMPGGQSTNLYQQAASLGMAHRWDELCRLYADVNQLVGDIVKVTPTSKSVGDMALFLLANNLSAQDVLDAKRELAYPESVVDLLAGRMGQPPGGWPIEVQKRILRNVKPHVERPGATLPAADFDAVAKQLETKIGRPATRQELLSYLLYERVFEEFNTHVDAYSDVSVLPTITFLYGQEPQEELAIEIESGKTLIVKFQTVGDPHPDGHRSVFFELNGQPREVTVIDKSLTPEQSKRSKADLSDPLQVAAPMPGLVSKVAVQAGDQVVKGQKLLTMEAMKMETTLYAEQDARIAETFITSGTQVETGDLLIRLEKV